MKKRARRKIPVVTVAGINIRQLREDSFQVDLYRAGRRERVCFPDLEQAKTHALILSRKIENEGASALDLTPAQRRDATAALAVLKDRATLETAAKFWTRHNAIGEGVTLKELGDRFLTAKRAAGCRETTLAEREHKIGRLVKDVGDQSACSITKDMIVNWLDGWKLVGVTRDGYRRCFHALFEYAVAEKIVDYNPVHAIEPYTADEKLPVPFTVEAVRSIMATAEAYAPVMVPTLAVQFFAGLRPGEAKGLKWEDVDWTEKSIRVLPETSKMRRTRHVDMNDALLAWLTRYRRESGPIGVRTQNQVAYFLHVKKCGEHAGLIKGAGVNWIQDGPRKTFASMHYATHQDAAKLAAMLGHTGNLNILFRHYRGLVKKTEAARYWEILPHVESNIIRIGASA